MLVGVDVALSAECIWHTLDMVRFILASQQAEDEKVQIKNPTLESKTNSRLASKDNKWAT